MSATTFVHLTRWLKFGRRNGFPSRSLVLEPLRHPVCRIEDLGDGERRPRGGMLLVRTRHGF